MLTDIDRWNDTAESITLMTVHSAKGLEFNQVFISGLEDGLFPIIRYLENSDIEEERRLFYVALTRSKKKLILSYAKSRRKFGSEPIVTMKSRFITEIPKELITFESNNNLENSKNYNYNLATTYRMKNNSTFKINIGNNVEHKVFGKGKVINIEGVGDNSKLTIKFYNNMTKKLIFKYANLKIIGDNYGK